MKPENYLGLVALAVVLYYVFNNPQGVQGTGNLIKSIADANVSGVSALQGRPVNGGGYYGGGA